jgi:hypothetical protein
MGSKFAHRFSLQLLRCDSLQPLAAISDATATQVLKTFEKSGVFDSPRSYVSLIHRTYANLLPFFRARNIERMRTKPPLETSFQPTPPKIRPRR